jgi:hypothetical protein
MGVAIVLFSAVGWFYYGRMAAADKFAHGQAQAYLIQFAKAKANAEKRQASHPQP